MRRACFIDRDGVVNERVSRDKLRGGDGRPLHYTAPWVYSEFRLCPRVKDALALLGELSFLRILVTNQPDVAYGRLSVQDHDRIMADVAALPLDDIYVCPHRSSDGCDCKKPKPGMLLAAAKKWVVDLRRSFLIGDRDTDIMAGMAAGCQTILVRSDNNQVMKADFYADDLFGAALLVQRLLSWRIE